MLASLLAHGLLAAILVLSLHSTSVKPLILHISMTSTRQSVPMAPAPALAPALAAPHTQTKKPATTMPQPVISPNTNEPAITSTTATNSPSLPVPAITSSPPTPAAPMASEPIPATQPVVNTTPETPARFDAAYLHNPQPIYPLSARRRGWQGEVLLTVWVSATGEATKVEVTQSSSIYSLDESAIAAVQTWRFVPAQRGGVAIASTVTVPIIFKLN